MLNDSTDTFLRFKNRLNGKGTVYGLAVTVPGAAFCEITANAGYDFVWIETEHTTLTLPEVETMIVACENRGCIPLVRVRNNEPNTIGQVLDMGAKIVNIPHVDTVDDALRAVEAAKYYPLGRRGYATMTRSTNQGSDRLDLGLMQRKNEETMLMVQIESVAAVENVDAIAELDGVDALFVGYADLCQDMGLAPDPNHPRCAEAIECVGQAIKQTGKHGMFIVSGPEALPHYRALGFDMILCGMDSRIFAAGARAVRESFDL